MQIFDHNIGFGENRQFFRRKLAKIAENCDHNIGPKFHKKRKKSARIFFNLRISSSLTFAPWEILFLFVWQFFFQFGLSKLELLCCT
jgi:hypothetical protein